MPLPDPCSQVVARTDVELAHAVGDVDQYGGPYGRRRVPVHVIDLPRTLSGDLNLDTLTVDLDDATSDCVTGRLNGPKARRERLN
jgi:hypothetical protein